MPRSKRWPIFLGVNVPLIIHVPEKWKHLASSDYKVAGSQITRVGFVDLAPTLLSIAGKKAARSYAGSCLYGKDEDTESRIWLRISGPNGRTIRHGSVRCR